jgi:hypothetical protein
MAVVAQLIGAVARAMIVMLVVATPSLLLPGTTSEGAQMATLIGLALALFICAEYASRYPAMIEFRDAPPFNRVRFLTLFLALFCLSYVTRAGSEDPSTLVLVLSALGLLVGRALDFSWSPLRVMMEHLPDDVSEVTALDIQILAGLAVFIMLSGLSVFLTLVRLQHWPNRGSAFNVWINLPTFEPTQGGDVVTRLTRDARVNVILGFTLPFVIPYVYARAAEVVELDFMSSAHALVWGITLWVFLPFSMLMRGVAMSRIADMIALRRARLTAAVSADAPSAVATAARIPAASR